MWKRRFQLNVFPQHGTEDTELVKYNILCVWGLQVFPSIVVDRLGTYVFHCACLSFHMVYMRTWNECAHSAITYQKCCCIS